MANLTLLTGALLTLLGLSSYFPDRPSVTALIPAFFGIPLALSGLLARNPERRKLASHVAVLISLLGAFGAGSQWAKKGFAFDAEGPRAQGIMTILCVLHVALSVRSFIQARKNAS